MQGTSSSAQKETVDWWKWTASACAGALLTGIASYASMVAVGLYRWQTAEQVREIVKNDSFYVREKPLVDARLGKAERDVERLEQKFDVIISGQSDIKTSVALINKTLGEIERRSKALDELKK